MRRISIFGRFWYDFIVGDSLTLAIGGCAVIAISALIVWLGFETAAEIVMPLLVVATLAWSLHRSS
jgi:hypothetical protein